MNVLLLISGLLALIATFGHTFGGINKVLPPILKASFHFQDKVTIQAVWYALAINLFFFSACLLILGFNQDLIDHTRWLVRLISIQYFLYSIVYLIISINSGINKGVLKIFQWIIFLFIAIISWLSV